jgi:hydrogenase-4 component F
MSTEQLLLIEPLIGGLLCGFISKNTLRRSLLILFSLGHFVLTLFCVIKGPDPHPGNLLGADALSLLFLLITSTLFLPVSIAMSRYLARQKTEEKPTSLFASEAVFTAALLLFLFSMTLAILSQHIGLFWMAVEATTLSSAPLICYHRSAQTLEAAWKYLLICSVGIAMALIGNIALMVATSFDPALTDTSLAFAHLIQHAHQLQPIWIKIAFVFFLIGYGTKMGLAPMHTWLPDAHSEAPSPVSALLSGALLNCAFLGIIRIQMLLRAAGLEHFSQELLLFFGISSMLIAGMFIIRQTGYKRMLAYSSVEHMGILAVALGCAGSFATFGGMFHALNHSLIKGSLFLTAGLILHRYRTKNIDEVTGILQRSPITGVLWILGFLAICGVPPFSVFNSEMSIMTGLATQHHWIILGLMLLALALVFIGLAALMPRMAYGTPQANTEKMPPEKPIDWIPPVLLCATSLVLGIWMPAFLRNVIQMAADQIGS